MTEAIHDNNRESNRRRNDEDSSVSSETGDLLPAMINENFTHSESENEMKTEHREWASLALKCVHVVGVAPTER